MTEPKEFLLTCINVSHTALWSVIYLGHVTVIAKYVHCHARHPRHPKPQRYMGAGSLAIFLCESILILCRIICILWILQFIIHSARLSLVFYHSSSQWEEVIINGLHNQSQLSWWYIDWLKEYQVWGLWGIVRSFPPVKTIKDFCYSRIKIVASIFINSQHGHL